MQYKRNISAIQAQYIHNTSAIYPQHKCNANPTSISGEMGLTRGRFRWRWLKTETIMSNKSTRPKSYINNKIHFFETMDIIYPVCKVYSKMHILSQY